MDLLENAVQSIQVGVEDYVIGSGPRLLSSARNIHAGILLLFKEALLRLSPPNSEDALIKSAIVPTKDASGSIVFVGRGKSTVKRVEIEERFKALSISTDWKRFDKINRVRNEVEHFYTNLTQAALQGLIADSFLLIRNFIQSELGAEPHNLLGDQTWQTMLHVSEVYEEEKKQCAESLDKVDWESDVLASGVLDLSCRVCGSELLKPREQASSYQDTVLICSSCGDEENFESFIPRAVQEALQAEAYISIKDGGESPYVSCPECGSDTYIVEENRCALCGERAETTCVRCGCEIPPEELSTSPMCSWCAHVSSKDD
jgi:ribosomal protein L37E